VNNNLGNFKPLASMTTGHHLINLKEIAIDFMKLLFTKPPLFLRYFHDICLDVKDVKQEF